MSHPASTWTLLPAGASLIRIHVRFSQDGSLHVAQFPCFTIEMTDEVLEAAPHTLFYLETTFSPIVFEIVNETHLEL